MTLLVKTIVIGNEAQGAPCTVAKIVEECLEELKLDTYNNEYVVTVTVQKVDTVVA